MLTKEYIKKVLWCVFKQIEIDSLYIKSDFDANYSTGSMFCNDEVIEFKDDIFIVDGDAWYFRCGASKMVLICDDYDEVIKIPFTGMYYEEYEDATEYQQDYIDTENVLYEESSETLRKILLKNTFVMKYGELPIYTQKRIKMNFLQKFSNNTDLVDPIMTRYVKKLIDEDNRHPNDLPATYFLVDIMKYFGEEGRDIIRQIEFDDMNNLNYGYMNDGCPVIFDYAGFDY